MKASETTPPAATAEARIQALEAACAHQDRMIAELSDVVAAQWKRIDALTREVLRLRDEAQALSQLVVPDKPPASLTPALCQGHRHCLWRPPRPARRRLTPPGASTFGQRSRPHY